MQKQDQPQIKRRKHKSDFFVFNQTDGRIIKPRRLSCIVDSQQLTMEESKISIVNQCIEEIVLNVFDSIDNAKRISQLFLIKMEQKVDLIQYFEFYNSGVNDEQSVPMIKLEQEPKNQPNYKVMLKKQKVSQSCYYNKQRESQVNEPNIKNSSNLNSKSLQKLKSKQKISRLSISNHNIVNRTSRPSIRLNRNSSLMALPNKNQSIIHERQQTSQQKQKRRKQDIIKKLLKEHQQKLKEVTHYAPQPIIQEYRAFFTQPSTRQEEELRSSFLYLRQLKQAQQKQNREKISKRALNKSLITQSSSKQNLQGIKLPTIYKQVKNRTIQSVSLFAQDQNGSIIKIKDSQKSTTKLRQSSVTMHENLSKKPKQAMLKKVSKINKHSVEFLKNEKIIPDSKILQENSSIISNMSHSLKEEQFRKQLLKNLSLKKGVFLKQPSQLQSPQMVVELQGLKLPLIMQKRT